MAECICKLLSINVYHQTESDGDEIFLRLGRKRIWPTKERYRKLRIIDSVINVDLKMDNCRIGDDLEVQLCEYDNLILNRCLGTFKLPLNSLGGPYTTTMQRSKKYFSSYALVWEVV